MKICLTLALATALHFVSSPAQAANGNAKASENEKCRGAIFAMRAACYGSCQRQHLMGNYNPICRPTCDANASQQLASCAN